tara:strand:+ start:228 stop:1238 length:1011 start_codon:yes stop_codon:yes gene_type:complete
VKIIFWGTPKYAADNLIEIFKAGHEIIAAVTQPDRKRGRGKKLTPSPVKNVAIDLGIPVLTTPSISKDHKTKEILRNLNADIFVVVAFGQILPSDILDYPKFGCWNSHASLLPAWRGAAPIQWSILSGDSKTGVCIMSMEEGLDTGPVIEQEAIDINDSDNLEVLTNRLSKISSKLLLKSLKRIQQLNKSNKATILIELKAVDQSKLQGKPTYARQIKKDDYLIDWNQKAKKIIRQIYGLYPNAFTLFKGKRIKILEGYVVLNNNQLFEKIFIDRHSNNKRIPGEIIQINKSSGIIIMSGDFPIQIKYGQLEGKSVTDSHTLSVQSKLNVKDIFGN